MDILTLSDSPAQAIRARRACEETFSFAPHPAGEGHFWCFSHATGKSYRVSAKSCTCKDFEWRCAGTRERCKHQLGLLNLDPQSMPQGVARDADEVQMLAKVAGKGREQRASDAKRFAEIFG